MSEYGVREPRETLPDEVVETSVEWLDGTSALDIQAHIYDCYLYAHRHRLMDAIPRYSDQFDIEDEVLGDGQAIKASRQGILFGMAIGEEWLSDEEWLYVVNAWSLVEKELQVLVRTPPDTECIEGIPIITIVDIADRQAETVLQYGLAGLDMVQQYRFLVEKCVRKIEPEVGLHEHFMASAGYVMRVLVAARSLHQAAETQRGIQQLEELLSEEAQASADATPDDPHS
jgi:hypothetical protein